jgi:hypothetical protein
VAFRLLSQVFEPTTRWVGHRESSPEGAWSQWPRLRNPDRPVLKALHARKAKLVMGEINKTDRLGASTKSSRRRRAPGKILRRAPDRFDPARVLKSRSRPRRRAPTPHPGPLLRVFSSESHAPLARQGCAGRQANRALPDGRDRGDPRSRWPAPSLRPPSGLVPRQRENPQTQTCFIPVAPSAPAASRTILPCAGVIEPTTTSGRNVQIPPSR